MRKNLLLILIIVLLFSFTGCYSDGSIIGSLPEYKKKEFYSDDSVQTFTDFGKYTYEDIKKSDFENSEYFSEVNEDDIKKIISYTDNFTDVISSIKKADSKADIVKKYEFENSIITKGDYFYIKTREGKAHADGTYGKFDNYSVYFMDMDSMTLYYFHCDI